jgi:hypothetical protein
MNNPEDWKNIGMLIFILIGAVCFTATMIGLLLQPFIPFLTKKRKKIIKPKTEAS